MENLKKSLKIKDVKLVGFSEDGNQPITYPRLNAAPGAEYPKIPSSVILAGENEFVSNVSLVFEIR